MTEELRYLEVFGVRRADDTLRIEVRMPFVLFAGQKNSVNSIVQHNTVRRDLPIKRLSNGQAVAVFDMLGDWELIEMVGTCLAQKMPQGVDVLLMPDGKAQALLHVLGRITELPTVVARKSIKSYMRTPILSVSVQSITTKEPQSLHLDYDARNKIKGRKVLIVDDVVSTGGTLDATKVLLQEAGATLAGVMAVFTEGARRDDVIALGHLPVFGGAIAPGS